MLDQGLGSLLETSAVEALAPVLGAWPLGSGRGNVREWAGHPRDGSACKVNNVNHHLCSRGAECEGRLKQEQPHKYLSLRHFVCSSRQLRTAATSGAAD